MLSINIIDIYLSTTAFLRIYYRTTYYLPTGAYISTGLLIPV